MAQSTPTSNDQFLRINGVGRTKLDRYGPAFLEAIQNHMDGN